MIIKGSKTPGVSTARCASTSSTSLHEYNIFCSVGALMCDRALILDSSRNTGGDFLLFLGRAVALCPAWDLEPVWWEQRRPGCLLSVPGSAFEVQTVLCLRDLLHLFPSEVLGPPRDAFTWIYKVCNLACVGFLIFWVAKIKHAAHLQGILFDSRAASFVPDNNWSQPRQYPRGVVKCSRVAELSLWLAFISTYLQQAKMSHSNREFGWLSLRMLEEFLKPPKVMLKQNTCELLHISIITSIVRFFVLSLTCSLFLTLYFLCWVLQIKFIPRAQCVSGIWGTVV